MKRINLTTRIFEMRSTRVAGCECWLWHPRDGRESYGQIRIDGKNMLAHRMSWIAANGEIPDGMLVCHRCDTPRCVNPAHLFLGSHKDNMDDAISKKRMYVQAESRDFAFTRKPRVRKLTNEDAEAIRQSKESLAILSKRYDVTMGCVSLVRRGKRK